MKQWARIAGIGDDVAQVVLSSGDTVPTGGGASFTEDGGIK